ncbi:MAG: outer membrane protein assembly factor BamA [Rickettsiales bacterium]|nr:MAG: outer membrane protein assembly factor BamA [Rickettsiales bacterium]
MKKIVFFFLMCITFAFSANVSKIQIKGNERIDNTYILSFLKIKQGDIYTTDKLNNSIKSLYESGFFEKVDINFNNSVLNVEVIEYPLIMDVYFEGNDEFDDDILTKEISLTKKSIFNTNKLNSDLKRIINLYKGTGKFEAKVIPEMIKESANRIKLIFKIEEGQATKIDEIRIIGTKEYSEGDLLSEIRSKEWHWYKFGIGSNYIPDLVELDKDTLSKFYLARGYIDFEILSVNADVEPDNKWVHLTFLLSEGEQYFYGDTTLTNNLPKVNDEELIEITKKIKKGKVFNNEKVNEIVDELNQELAKEGYVFVEIAPQMKRGDDNMIDLNFVIQESPRIYIGSIKIIGNTRTHDDIIRKELRFGEGDPLNMTNYNRSISKLYGTGYFEKVDIERERGDEPDKVNLVVIVKERKTGELSFGVGYSTLDGANANIGVNESNLFGRGHNIGVNLTIAQYSRDITLSYGKPNFWGRDLYMGTSIYYQFDKDDDALDYDEARIGGSVYGIYDITDYLRQRLFYSAYRQKITSVSGNYVGLVKEKDIIVSSIGQTLYFDSRDNKMDTENGMYHTWTGEMAGIGGDKTYFKNTATLNWYIPIFPKYLTFKLGGFLGAMDGYKQKLDSTDGFYLNGNLLRGFKYGGVGPRINGKNGMAVAGKYYYVGIAELKFPLLPKEYGVFGGLFYNAGTLTGTDLEKVSVTGSSNPYDIYDSGSVRSAYGLTIYWNTPMGLLNLTFSKPVDYEEYDKPEEFFFNFGMGF